MRNNIRCALSSQGFPACPPPHLTLVDNDHPAAEDADLRENMGAENNGVPAANP